MYKGKKIISVLYCENEYDIIKNVKKIIMVHYKLFVGDDL